MSSRNHTSLFRSVSWLLVALGTVSLSQACANRADDCDANSTCTGMGGTAMAGTSPTAGKAGGSEAGDGGSSTAGSAAGGHAGEGGGNAGSSAGGQGGSASQPCDGACSAPTPVCEEATDTCVECLGPTDCAAGDEDLCDTTSNICVECLAPADCGNAAASRCDGGACVECEDSNDCAHIAGKGVCDDGECVQCTVAEETACAGKSCNPATNACTTTTLGSIDYCEPCVADSECLGGNKADPDARCMPMEFNGTARDGGFCFRRVAKTCTRPFQIPLTAASLSGAASEAYCGINQDDVTCEAVLDLIGDINGGKACQDGDDSSCGCARDVNGDCTAAGSGGLCRTVGVNANRCTYACGSADQCPTGFTCTGGQPYCH